MMWIVQAVHDTWCALTRRCRVVRTPFIDELEREERESLKRIEQSKKRLHELNLFEEALAADILRKERE